MPNASLTNVAANAFRLIIKGGLIKKLLAMTAVAGLMSVAVPSSANAAYLFAFTPSGVQTLTINGTTVIQANQTGWFNSSGTHTAENTNYFVGDLDGQQHNNFFGFDLSNISGVITSAVLNIGNDLGSGLSGGPVTWTTYDVDGAINTNQSYSNVGIFTDLGSGTSYGAVGVAAPTSNVSLALNASGLAAVSNSVGKSFFVGGTLTPLVAAVPEPATWLMMILGFAAIGGVMRRKDSVTTRVRFA